MDRHKSHRIICNTVQCFEYLTASHSSCITKYHCTRLSFLIADTAASLDDGLHEPDTASNQYMSSVFYATSFRDDI
jgi:hypothetical protein